MSTFDDLDTKLHEQEFRDLLDLMMVSDPWPLDEEAHNRLKFLLNSDAREYGYNDWIEAYHEFDPHPEVAA